MANEKVVEEAEKEAEETLKASEPKEESVTVRKIEPGVSGKKPAKKAGTKKPAKKADPEEPKNERAGTPFVPGTEKTGFRTYTVSGKYDTPYGPAERSKDRNTAFRVAKALSLTEKEAGTKKAKENLPAVLEIRYRLKKAGIEISGKGYTRTDFAEALKAIRPGLERFAGFSGFRPSSKRFNVEEKDGFLRLKVKGLDLKVE